MAKKTTPTTLTTELLHKFGYHVELVEHRHPFNQHVTVDLMNFADLLAMSETQGLVLVQATSDDTSGNHSARRKKILASDKARQWVVSGGRILLISWRRPVRGGVKSERWQARVEEIKLTDFAAAAAGE